MYLRIRRPTQRSHVRYCESAVEDSEKDRSLEKVRKTEEFIHAACVSVLLGMKSGEFGSHEIDTVI